MKHKSKKNRPTRTGAHTASQFLRQVQVPYIPTPPIGWGSYFAPPPPPSGHPTSDLATEYEQFFEALHDIQGFPDTSWTASINQSLEYLLGAIENATNKPRPQTTLTEGIITQPEEGPKRPTSWQELLDDVEDENNCTGGKCITDVIPTTPDILDIFDELPDPLDDIGDTPPGEPDNIHDDDEPPAPDTQIKDKLPSADPTCEETEAYLRGLGIDVTLCSGLSKETRIIGKI